jgi:hypothetical protein
MVLAPIHEVQGDGGDEVQAYGGIPCGIPIRGVGDIGTHTYSYGMRIHTYVYILGIRIMIGRHL